MKTQFYRGILPALVTPVEDNGVLREQAVRDLMEWELQQGADGFYICGGTGEGLVLQKHTRMAMCEVCIDQIHGRVPVIDHIAAMNASDSIELAKHVEKAGADAVASIPPFYFAYSEEDIYQYYKALAAAVDIPVMVYFVPSGGVSMSPELIARIFKIENVTAVKWSSSDYFQMIRLLDMTGGEINLINGPDETLLCGLAAGAHAGIGSTYNIMLPEFKAMYTAFQEGRMEEARAIQYRISRIIAVLCQYKVIPSVKRLLEVKGFPVGNATFPMRRFTEEEAGQLLEDVRQCGWR